MDIQHSYALNSPEEAGVLRAGDDIKGLAAESMISAASLHAGQLSESLQSQKAWNKVDQV